MQIGYTANENANRSGNETEVDKTLKVFNRMLVRCVFYFIICCTAIL